MHGAELELDVRGDRAVLTGTGGRQADAAAFSLGDDLTAALHEWARVSAAVGAGARRAPESAVATEAAVAEADVAEAAVGEPAVGEAAVDGAAVVAHRGRQLAGRVAAALGVTVSYHDPVAGRTFVAVSPAEETALEAEPPPLAVGADRGRGRFDAVAEWWRTQAERNPGPVPWATGSLVGAFFAVVMGVAMLALAGALASATHGLVAIVAALVVSAGLAPSLWLGRRVPVVRWIVGGVAAGIALSWIGVLVIAL